MVEFYNKQALTRAKLESGAAHILDSLVSK